MTGWLIIPDVVVRVACTALLAIGLSTATDKQSRVVPLPAERQLSVDVTVGNVSIRGEVRSDVQIDIVRTAPSAALLTHIPVRIEESPERVHISLVQRDGGTHPDLRTNLALRVPHRAVLDAIRVMEGRVTLSSFAGQVTADVRRGPIDAADVTGIVRFETGIGDVTVKNARLSRDGLLRLRAFNGDVRLQLAERPSDARVMALALNGTIASDIPLRTRDTWGPRWGEASLGRGEPVISLDVVTGRIQITSP